MPVRIRRYTDAARFAERVEPWLMRREAEHNLLLGLLPRLARGVQGVEGPIYLAAVEEDDEVVGCAFRTPPHKLSVTRLAPDAIAPLVEDVARVYAEIPTILGPEDVVTRFAELWSREKACEWALGTRQRIHSLERVRLPDSPPPGALRLAVEAEIPRISDWMDAFSRDTGTPADPNRERGVELARSGSLHVWDDGEPRSMLAVNGETPNGVRVGFVYTPPSLRGRGYATAAVACLSDQVLRSGRRFCFLYTDLSNPTSNAIYARIGYTPVCDVVDVDFGRHP